MLLYTDTWDIFFINRIVYDIFSFFIMLHSIASFTSIHNLKIPTEMRTHFKIDKHYEDRLFSRYQANATIEKTQNLKIEER